MKKVLKKGAKKTIDVSMDFGKKLLDINPGLKDKLKCQILSNINIPSAENIDDYKIWVMNNTLDAIDLLQQREESEKFKYKPLISIVVPTYNTPKKFFNEMIESVLSQTYDNWELIIIDDASPDDETRSLINSYTEIDSRIKSKFLKKNLHIAGATNEGIKIARGEFVSLFDHDDILWPNALFEIVKALNKNKKLNFIYTDEDKIDGENRYLHKDPFFKPDWNHDLLRSVNYITHFTTIRKSILDKFGYEDGKYNGAQDWELFLRITRNIDDATIHHVETIAYSWRVHDQSTAKNLEVKPYVFEAQKKAIEDDLIARGVKGAKVIRDKKTNYWTVEYPVINEPLVSIVIPTKNLFSMLKKCVDSIYEITEYKNFEIILVDTGSTDQNVLNWYKKMQKKHTNFKVYTFVEEKFSYAKACNFGAKKAKGELLLMLNNDIEVTMPKWLNIMIGYAQRPEVGVVGVKLYYPEKSVIQHGGVGVGMGGCAVNLFQGKRESSYETLAQSIMLHSSRDVSAVTAACAMIRSNLFEDVGGFKEKYRINYNDIDLCLTIKEKGFKNVYVPRVNLIHHESISRGLPTDKKHDSSEFLKAQRLFKRDWQKYIKKDPHVNSNFNKNSPHFDI